MADFENLIPDLSGHNDLEIFGDDSSKIKTVAFNLDGNIFDIAFCDYSEKYLLIISQYQKIGTLILVTKGCVQNLSGATDVYDVKTICGVDSEEYHLATRYLAQQLNFKKPVLFGICLKDVSLKTLKGITKALRDNLEL